MKTTTKKTLDLCNSLLTPVCINNTLQFYSNETLIVITDEIPDGNYYESGIKMGNINPEAKLITDEVLKDIKEAGIIPNITAFLPEFTECAKHCGNTDWRPQLSGVFYDSEQKKLIATDAHSLIWKNDINLGDKSFILSKIDITLINKIVKFAPITECYLLDDKYLQIVFAHGITVYCILIDGKYPAYEGVIPNYHTGMHIVIADETRANVSDLLRTIKKTNKTGLCQCAIDTEAKKIIVRNVDLNILEYFDITIITDNITLPVDHSTIYQNFDGLLMPTLLITNDYRDQKRDDFFSDKCVGVDFNLFDRFKTSTIFFSGQPEKAFLIPIKTDNKLKTKPTMKTKETDQTETKPAPENVPSKIKEVASASPNIHICSIPKSEQPAEQTTPPQASINIVVSDYSERAIVVTGDTKPVKEQLKQLGGRFNPNLKTGAGWVFSKKRESEIKAKFNL